MGPEENTATSNAKWIIDKSFNFCYGHRVWVQEINTDYTESGHTCAKCRHPHGHEGLVKVFLRGGELNSRAMVEDFVNLGWVKNFLDDYLDHKFILDLNDPWFSNMLNAEKVYNEDVSTVDGKIAYKASSLHSLIVTNNNSIPQELLAVPVFVPGTRHFVGYQLDVSEIHGAEKEFYEGYFFVDFVPTSEKLCEWLFHAIDAKMSLIDVEVSSISWNETPKSRAVYYRD